MQRSPYVQPMNIITSWTPLSAKVELDVEGGSTEQYYYANAAAYQPSRLITPCTLHPRLYIIDPDGVIPNGYQNNLTIRWYEQNASDAWVEMTNRRGSLDFDPSLDYIIESNGSLVFSRNVSHLQAQQLKVEIDFTDLRSAVTTTYFEIVTFNTILKEDTRLRLEIDAPPVLRFNPFRHTAQLALHAKAYLGKELLTSGTDVKFFWYKLQSDGSEVLIDQDEGAIEYVSGQNTDTLTIDRMKTVATTVRLRAGLYESNTAPVSPDSAAYTDVTLVYYVPKLTSMVYCPSGDRLRASADSKTFIVKVSDALGVLTDQQVAEHCLVRWNLKTTQAGSTTTYFGDGVSITIPAKNLRTTGGYRMSVKPEVYLLGPYQLIANGSGAVIVNASGEALIGRSIDY